MKVWVCTTGAYSDYQVIGVRLTEESARALLSAFEDANDPEEYDTEDLAEPEDQARHGLFRWRVCMLKDGTVRSAFRLDFEAPPSVEICKLYPYGEGNFGIEACVYARDKQHAVKIVNEHRAQLIATGAWPDEPPPPAPVADTMNCVNDPEKIIWSVSVDRTGALLRKPTRAGGSGEGHMQIFNRLYANVFAETEEKAAEKAELLRLQLIESGEWPA